MPSPTMITSILRESADMTQYGSEGHKLRYVASALLLMFCSSSVGSAADTEPRWPAFLGAGATLPASLDSLPLTWSPTENIAWQVPIVGYGQSSPVVWGDLVFITSVDGPNKEKLITSCYGLAAGELVWQTSIENSSPVESSLYVSRAAPTPLVDGNLVIAQFESGDCVAYSLAGEEVWRRSLGKDYGPFIPEFGLGASPCQTEELAFVLLEQDGPSCLVALSKKTGKDVWRIERSPRQSWSSPAIIVVDGLPQVVVSSAGTVDGYDALSGKPLWSFNDVGGNTATTPIDYGGGRFLIAASAGRSGENAANAKKSNALMTIARDGDQWKVERGWVAAEASPSWGSPIIHQGLAYWVNRVGVVYCYDAVTGEEVYTKRTQSSCWATPVGIGDRIYIFGKDGLTTVLAAGREFTVLAENKLWNPGDIAPTPLSPADQASEERRGGAAMFGGPTVYGAVIAGNDWIVRVGNRLFCIRK
jgi:outer membrane protein assembly factor BamB